MNRRKERKKFTISRELTPKTGNYKVVSSWLWDLGIGSGNRDRTGTGFRFGIKSYSKMGCIQNYKTFGHK